MINLQETIRPSADLRNHYSDISRQCKENKEAVIITVNGRGDTVTLSYEEYKNMKARIELLEVLAEAEDDVKNGRVAPVTDTFDDLRKMLKED
ncbi:MAG: type II toxin-antitoxin system Phd/YefM family antitoxin [Lachnospiraceae bacterium]|nr:type II toxin-antitoxin system Phd/YefM family antitoxin [Lachnospiraceae bacterium]